MSKTTLAQLECDRCRCIVVVDEEKHSPDVAHWGEVAAYQPRQVDQPFREQLLDLCGGCIADLVKFMSGSKLERTANGETDQG